MTYSKKTYNNQSRVTTLFIVRGGLIRRVMGGPKTNTVQMISFHFVNILLSFFFFCVNCKYLGNFNDFPFIFFELIFTLLASNFALTCSFRDPGIVTSKTNLFMDIEDAEKPAFVKNGNDFYRVRRCY